MSALAPVGAGTVAAVSASCSRPTCARPPAATLTYDYGARTATLDHLASPHPMQYDLCAAHTDRLSVPNGWMLVDRRIGRVVDLHGRIAP
jgi:hypothetical protein